MSDDTVESNALVPVREQTVDFYGDAIPAGQLADGTILVPVRPIVDALGMGWGSQYNRLRRDPVLAEALTVFIMKTVQGDREMMALPLKLLPGFLFGLNSGRVKPELREKILRYQRDCYEVLWTAFKGDIQAVAPAPSVDLNPVEQALLLAEAVASMAREHLALDQRVTTMAEYTRGFIQQTRTHQARTDDRLTALELHLGSGATISEPQAAEIAAAVKAVAQALEGRGIANPYQQVWGELYKRYRVGAYRNLPNARYAEALGWLQGWYSELSGNEIK